MSEEWRDISGFEGIYMVSNTGRVMNIAKGMRRQQNHVFTVTLNTFGYPQVMLTRDGISKAHRVHRLVASEFLPNANNFYAVNHIDGNKTNNNVSNLEWCTSSHNEKHAYDNGLKKKPIGTLNGRNKLTELQVINIMHCKGSITGKKLAELYDVGRSTITSIWQGKNWNYLFEATK